MLGRPDPPEGFDAPWQAEAYAIGQALIEAGQVSANQWARTLNGVLQRKLQEEKLPDNVETYASALVEALGRAMAENGILSLEELEGRTEAWRHAYKRTPHGQPVELE